VRRRLQQALGVVGFWILDLGVVGKMPLHLHTDPVRGSIGLPSAAAARGYYPLFTEGSALLVTGLTCCSRPIVCCASFLQIEPLSFCAQKTVHQQPCPFDLLNQG